MVLLVLLRLLLLLIIVSSTEPINQLDQSFRQFSHQSITQPINQFINQSIDQRGHKCLSVSFRYTVYVLYVVRIADCGARGGSQLF